MCFYRITFKDPQIIGGPAFSALFFLEMFTHRRKTEALVIG